LPLPLTDAAAGVLHEYGKGFLQYDIKAPAGANPSWTPSIDLRFVPVAHDLTNDPATRLTLKGFLVNKLFLLVAFIV